ncbi:MAG: pyruvate-formate lyase-activating enzyme [Myxococcota bacterium]|jgi:pyruvate-formate lyase-activating enzyme
MGRTRNNRSKRRESRPSGAHLVYADDDGQIFDHPFLLMVATAGGEPAPPPESELVEVPRGSDLYTLPGRSPIGLNPETGELEVLEGPYHAVSTFLAPAWLRLRHPVYETRPDAPTLPLFAYAPMGFARGKFWTTGVRVDPEARQDPWTFDLEEIERRVAARREASPKNRMIEQLQRCSIEYGCRASQNYFLARYEAPLPTSEGCNAACVGCISLDPVKTTAAHERIVKSPDPEEIAEVACEHIDAVDLAVVSFGQGCEGEPLLRAPVLEESIRIIRGRTDKGTIHLNSNGSLPKAVDKLCEAGLQSIRISMNSAVEETYKRYYRPRTYKLADVAETAAVVTKHGGFVSLNLLVFPGVSDLLEEVEALETFIEEGGVDMIQMRNLNVDPELYRKLVGEHRCGEGMGLVAMMERLRARFPNLRYGYFNPPHQSFGDAPGPIIVDP